MYVKNKKNPAKLQLEIMVFRVLVIADHRIHIPTVMSFLFFGLRKRINFRLDLFRLDCELFNVKKNPY